MKIFKTNNQLETIEVGKKIGNLLNPGDVCLLIGDLSAGKTTITKGIGMALGVKKVINSPTFTIVKGYKGDKGPFYHLDLYRLDGVNNDFDLEEYMEGDGVCVIEWPFQVSEILPKEYLRIDLERLSEEERKITISGIGRYQRIEEAL
ncbi:MAG: tRNA (adenosine(37)-N6)-threonylcarbamoyltransferase complex ATPase subunit type 1 TsaE [Anaeroplasma sp.]|uniref:tRNA (adenosine(37)-N6)-threonylcarbamoyltransferase complex ATPase subunit type 1 TsaE n=1 Tax=Anaeroplasma sp. TaxID=1872523 RepID=UPI002A916665|nr:tRNA (adenosine(37)-N6)-threonylcarbamoyltransferase complex ATPase subunit type 1 TsaE [Anaeroplasma sp.]MDY5983068.1 tRNA (adenosine(37)-N6)-threonylcarbamoyltransferase complex ATPase subunit type 1 TsaE [Anaeroplasma sp.]